MFKWLRNFFYSGDPDIKLAGGMNELDAAQYQELLANSGIMSMAKDASALAINRYVWPTAAVNAYGLWVKQSDVEAACQVLGHLLTRYETDETREVRQQLRDRKRREAG